jgi:site-specific recombinase XerD
MAIDGEATALISAWLERRKQLGLDGRKPLFCTLKGTALNPSYVRRLLPMLADRAELQRRVHPHILRHSRAKELAEQGVPINVIQQALGHTHLTTTSIYLDHVAPQQVIEAMRSSAWKLA